MVDLVPIALSDAVLFQSMFCDERHMAELGGAVSPEKALSILEKQVQHMQSGSGWVYKIVPTNAAATAEEQAGVGTVCLWSGQWRDEAVTEMGWGVAPRFQRRGYGTKAVAALLDKAAKVSRWGDIHAFTSLNNHASNRICHTVGFTNLGECEMDYDHHKIPANHWIFRAAAGLN